MTLPSPLDLEPARLAAEEVLELENLLGDLAQVSGTGHPWEARAGVRSLELLTNLTTAGARQARIGTGGGGAAGPAHTRPLPYSANPLEVREQLAGVLAVAAAATMRADANEAPIGPRRPAPRTLHADDVAAWLLTRAPSLSWHPGIARPLLDQLRPLVRRGRAMVDAPADRFYAGPCATPRRDDDDGLVIVDGEQAYCEAELWARPGLPVVVCRACGAHHRVEARRAELLRLARDRELNAADVSRALTSLGLPCTAERIRKWKQRQRLGVASVDADGKALYRVGDVMDLLVVDATRTTSRRPRKDTAA